MSVRCEVRARFDRAVDVESVYVLDCTHQQRMIVYGMVVLKNTENLLVAVLCYWRSAKY